MLALTLIQPWGTLIVEHGKDVENRSWPCPPRVIGQPLLIHAGKKIDPAGFRLAEELDIYLPDELPAGGIIGQVDVIGCIRNVASPWAQPGQWHWQLANPRPLPFQPLRGQMGLFHVGPKPDRDEDTSQTSLFA